MKKLMLLLAMLASFAALTPATSQAIEFSVGIGAPVHRVRVLVGYDRYGYPVYGYRPVYSGYGYHPYGYGHNHVRRYYESGRRYSSRDHRHYSSRNDRYRHSSRHDHDRGKKHSSSKHRGRR